MKRALVTGLCALTLAATSCTSGVPSASGTRTAVATRSLSITLSGAVTYSRSVAIGGGAIGVRYTGTNNVDRTAGTVTFPGLASGTADFGLDLTATGTTFGGVVAVHDPASGISQDLGLYGLAVSFDGDGDSTGTGTAGGVTVTWAITTTDAPGLEPVLDTLTADETDFCAKAQQSLAGLDTTQVPLGSITNNDYSSRGTFGGSKASLVPLTTQTWREPVEVDTANGNNVVITDSISCKTRSADHLATLGVTTAPDQQCSTLSTAAAARAWSLLTPAEQASYAASGKSLAFAPDQVEGTGIDWLTPITGASLAGNVMTIRAHALQVNWTDPNYVIFPDTIRGVHYCTTKSPAWFYWWYTKGAI